MFNWVCPRCGRENSPSYTECPDCTERDLQAQAEAAAQQPAPVPVPVQQYYQNPPQTQECQAPQPPQQQVVYAPQPPQPQYVQPPQQQYPPQPQYAPQPPQQYAQPPQYTQPQQYAQPPQYAPPQQSPPQYAPPQQQPPQYTQTQPIYIQQPIQQPVQQPPQQYAPPVQQPQPQYVPPPQQQYVAPPAPAPAPKPIPAPVAAPKPKPAYVPPLEKPEPGFGAKLSALPTPVLMLLFAASFLAIGAGIYFGYQKFVKGGASTPAGVQATASTKPKVTNPMQKYIEVVGIRLTTDAKKKPIAKFVVVNHASTEVSGLGAIVTLWASTSRSEEDAVGSFAFNVDTIGPYDSKEVSAPFKTKLKIYELPDWQNATPEIQITSPQP